MADIFGTSTAFTNLTMNSMAVFTGANGQQADLIDNSAGHHGAAIHVKITNNTGAAPTAYSGVEVYLIRANKFSSPDVIDDAAGTGGTTYPADASAGINAEHLGTVRNGTGGTGDVIEKTFIAENLGPAWTIALLNKTGQILHSSGHAAYYETIN